MKTIIKCALTLVVALFATSLLAQCPARKQSEKTPQQIAQSRTDKMDRALTLNEKQKGSIYAMYLKMGEQRQKAAAAQPATAEAKKETMKKMFVEHDTQLKSILTAEQYTKWQEIIKARKSKHGHHGKLSSNCAQKCSECPQSSQCSKAGECKSECATKACAKKVGCATKECPKAGECKQECATKECPKAGECKKEYATKECSKAGECKKECPKK